MKNSARHTLRLTGLVLFLIPAFANAFGQTAPPPTELTPNQPLTRRIKGGETQVFTFAVPAGNYARAEVAQKDIDVVVSLFAPDGKPVVEMDGKNGYLWRESVSALAENTDATFEIRIRAYGTAEQGGSYTLKLAESRPIEATDRPRSAAEQHFYKGRSFYLQATPNLSEAIKAYESAARIWRELGDKYWEGVALFNVAWVLSDSAKNEGALSKMESASALFQEIQDRISQGKASNGLGFIYSDLGQSEKSAQNYEKALAIRRELKDRRGEGVTLHNLGVLYQNANEYQRSIPYFEQALTIRREIKDKTGEGYSLSGLGHSYRSLYQRDKAILYYEQSAIVWRGLQNQQRETDALNVLGHIFTDTRQNEKAKDYYERALTIAKTAQYRSGEAEALLGIGAVFGNQSNQGKSIEFYERSLIIYRELKENYYIALILRNLGNAYLTLSQYEKATNYLEQALVIFREIKDRRGENDTIYSLGIVSNRLAQYEQAREYYEQALVIQREIKDRAGEGLTYRNLTVLAEKTNQPQLAILYGKQAVNIYQEIRGNIKGLDKESQQSFLADNIFIYRRLSDILIAEGRLAEAQAVLDLVKDQEYGQLTRSGETADTVPYSQSEKAVVDKIDHLAALGREQTELRKQQAELGDKFPADKAARLDQLAADIKAANAEFDRALTVLAKADVAVEARTLEIKGEKNLQSALQTLGRELKTGAVALYTVLGTQAETGADGKPLADKSRAKFGWIILVTPTDRKAYPIDVSNLEQLVFQFRSALSSDRYDPKPLAEKIYTALFRQTSEKQKVTLEQDLQTLLAKTPGKTLMWSLDGVLRYIPMAALHDGTDYLVEKYRNVLFTKESLLWLMTPARPNWHALGLGVSAGNPALHLSALPGVERELADIVQQPDDKTGILAGRRRLNAEFRRGEILSLATNENFQVVHIASHYSFNLTDQNASFLLVGDGKLTFGELNGESDLFGNVDLLTLSACDTGVAGNGRETEGFAYLAQSLGAKSVLASLWQVSDTGTPELMIRFYRQRAANPTLPKGEAFRQAQLALLRAAQTSDGTTPPAVPRGVEPVGQPNPQTELPLFQKDPTKPYAHPHYWASFVLIGNWR